VFINSGGGGSDRCFLSSRTADLLLINKTLISSVLVMSADPFAALDVPGNMHRIES
jgi:hypothetical protein